MDLPDFLKGIAGASKNAVNEANVSIVMIFLNAREFIEEAIESVRSQTYTDWQLILVDDGSTDGSSEIAIRSVQEDPERFIYLYHQGHRNLGMSASRNFGIRSSRGPYIAFLDADDVWMPDKLMEQVEIMESHPDAAMVCGRSQWWYSWTGRPEDAGRDFLQKLDVPLNSIVEPPELLIGFLKDWGASLCDILVRRECLDKVHGYENSFRNMYEDQVFHAKICLEYPVYVSSRCWYRYRQHADSCCSIEVSTGDYPLKKLAFLRWLKKYLRKQGYRDTHVWEIVRSELGSCPATFRSRLANHIRIALFYVGRHVLPFPLRHWLWMKWMGQTG